MQPNHGTPRHSTLPGEAARLPLPRRRCSSIGSSLSSSQGVVSQQHNLEEGIARCEALLAQFDKLTKPDAAAFTALKADGGRAAGDGAAALVPTGEPPDPGGGDAAAGKLRSQWWEVEALLRKLAADSLESSCSRSVPGAMDVYERTNLALDHMASLSTRPAVAAILATSSTGGGATSSTSPWVEAAQGGTPSSWWALEHHEVDGHFGRTQELNAAAPRLETSSLECCVAEATKLIVSIICAVACGCMEGFGVFWASLHSATPQTTPEAQQQSVSSPR